MKRSLFPSAPRRALVAASVGDFARLERDARAAAKAGADVLEVRADAFPTEALEPRALARALALARKSFPRALLLTLRSRAEGGRFPDALSEADRLALFRSALGRVQAVDVELSAPIAGRVAAEARRRGKTAIVSFHDFKGTPPDALLRRLVRRARGIKDAVLKVAAAPARAADVDRLMDFCRSLKGPRIFIAMGTLGTRTRLEGFRWGSCLTYGCVGRPMAPGQVPVRRLARAVRRTAATLIALALLAPVRAAEPKPHPRKVAVDLYVMSLCPFGVQAENALLPVVKLLRKRVDFRIHFIAGRQPAPGAPGFSSLHGRDEVAEDLRQVCARKRFPRKFADYLLERNLYYKDPEGWRPAAAAVKIDPLKLAACADGAEGAGLLADNIETARAKGFGVSPTIEVDGVRYAGPRSQRAFAQTLCARLSEKRGRPPKACRNIESLPADAPPITGGCRQ